MKDRISSLQYKTRRNSNPRGKARVYFSCYPDDFAACFDEISQDILAISNCAIYYDPDMAEELSDEETDAILSQMQLLVIPVTTQFLYQPNRAKSVEMEYALKHHIPILPLLQEEGLEQKFNEICGNLQILNKYDKSQTAIPFEEKLTLFLNSVLVSDELAEQIRDAFDAYIFMSYRKKDREHAKRLMHLIHEHPFCRDIAIWYDEYLIPGEDFNEAISEAMDKSQLFSMVITPNLVNEENYVKNVEYPEALHREKIIIPTELVPTDRDKLNEKYPDIPEVIRADQKEKLANTLLDNVKKLAIRANDHDPKHLLFIGLAYLNGIDVERDVLRAVDMITTAANMELPEAAEQLASMYWNGTGVASNYGSAIQWMKQSVEIRKQLCKTDSSSQQVKKYMEALEQLGIYLQQLDAVDEAWKVYAELEKIVSDDMVKGEVRWTKLMEVKIQLGSIARKGKRYEKAIGIFEELISHYMNQRPIDNSYKMDQMDRVAETIRIVTVYALLAESYVERAQDKEDYVQARENMRKGMELAEHIYQKRPDLQSVMHMYLSICQSAVYFADQMGDKEEIYRIAPKLLEISIQYDSEMSSVTSERMLVDAYRNYALSLEGQGKCREAKIAFDKALSLLNELYDVFGIRTINIKRRIARIHTDILVLSKELRLPKPERYFHTADSIYKEILKETRSAIIKDEYIKLLDTQIHLIQRDLKFFDGMSDSQVMQQKRHSLEEVEKTRSSLLNITVDEENLTVKQKVFRISSLAEKAEGLKRYQLAEAYYLEALELNRQYVEISGCENAYGLQLINYINLGKIKRKQKQFQKAKELMEEACVIGEHAVELFPSVSMKKYLADIYTGLGDAFRELKGYDSSLNYYLKTLELYQDICEETHTWDDQCLLGISYIRIGKLYQNMKEYEKAYAWFQKEIRNTEELEKTDPGVQVGMSTVKVKRVFLIYKMQANDYQNMGWLLDDAGKFEESISWYEKGLIFVEKIYDFVDNNEMKKFLLAYLERFIQVLRKAGKVAKADEYKKKVLEIRTDIITSTKAKIDEAMNSGHINIPVETQYDRLIQMQMDIVEQYQGIYTIDPKASHAWNYIESVYSLADLFLDIRHGDEVIEAYQNALSWCEEQADSFQEQYLAQTIRAYLYIKLAVCFINKEQDDQAKKYILQSQEICENIINSTQEKHVREIMADVCRISLTLTPHDKSLSKEECIAQEKKWISEYDKNVNWLLEQGITSQTLHMQYISHFRKSLIYKKLEDTQSEIRERDLALACADQEYQFEKTRNSMETLANAYRNRGITAIHLDDTQTAVATYEKAYSIYGQLVNVLDTYRISENYIWTGFDLIDYCRKADDKTGERKYYKELYPWSKRLANSLDTYKTWGDFFNICLEMGKTALEAKDREAFAVYMEELQESGIKLLDHEYKEVDVNRIQNVAWTVIQASEKEGWWKEAESYYSFCYRIVNNYVKRNPDVKKKDILFKLKLKLAIAAEHTEDIENSNRQIEQVIKYAETFIHEYQDESFLYSYAWVLCKYAERMNFRQDLLEKAYIWQKKLVDEYPDNESYQKHYQILVEHLSPKFLKEQEKKNRKDNSHKDKETTRGRFRGFFRRKE